jgi:hypothetical protein
MAKFYLNLYNDIDAIDEDGSDYPDLAAAKAVAVAGARDLMASHVQAGKPINLDHRIEVADADGKVLVVMPFSELITIRGNKADHD